MGTGTSILDEGTSQSDVQGTSPWKGKMYSVKSVPNGRLRTSKLDLVWTSTGRLSNFDPYLFRKHSLVSTQILKNVLIFLSKAFQYVLKKKRLANEALYVLYEVCSQKQRVVYRNCQSTENVTTTSDTLSDCILDFS